MLPASLDLFGLHAPPPSGLRGKILAVLEVLLAFGAMSYGFRVLGLAIVEWPQAASLTQLAVFVVAPLVWLLATRRKLDGFGLTFTTFGRSSRLAWRASAVVGPTCMVFWLVNVVGSDQHSWLGAGLIALAFLIAVPAVLWIVRGTPTRASTPESPKSVVVVLAVLAGGAAVSILVREPVPVLARLIHFVLIVGFCEEIAFRGYLQSRLNQAFGRPYRAWGVSFGPGLVVAAILFGVAHAIVAADVPWPRALFPAAFGLVLGFLREKDGSVLAAAILHGSLGVARVFLG